MLQALITTETQVIVVGTGHVVGVNQRCDGISDCIDGSDEEFCSSCRTSFKCPSQPGIDKIDKNLNAIDNIFYTAGFLLRKLSCHV
uniref:Peptidase S1 domain-containing protein n=1 Tax=Syphacia muris TaxID=451379 RepID=A0A0N5AMQ1_9BILA